MVYFTGFINRCCGKKKKRRSGRKAKWGEHIEHIIRCSEPAIFWRSRTLMHTLLITRVDFEPANTGHSERSYHCGNHSTRGPHTESRRVRPNHERSRYPVPCARGTRWSWNRGEWSAISRWRPNREITRHPDRYQGLISKEAATLWCVLLFNRTRIF